MTKLMYSKLMQTINVENIIEHFYRNDFPLRQLLLMHSGQVRDKALAILQNPACKKMKISTEIVVNGAMLHDIGILHCHAPKIHCHGVHPYIAHGVIGAEMLREYGKTHKIDFEPYARICERHTGSGISAAEIKAQNLQLPAQNFLPETIEEKLICLADKFYSKSGDMQEKSLENIRRSMAKFGPLPLARFAELLRLFGM
ncbi:MAG: HDIG domain-containing protein [Victivallales bacterium]|nr:HDIG domain-containing protein [Victivallales bacterium]